MKKAMLCFVLLLVVLIVGCRQVGRNVGGDTTSQYRVGSQGLEMRFAPNSPPSVIFDGDEAEFVVELRNRGAFPRGTDQFAGRLEITGFDQLALQNERWLEGSEIVDPRLQGRSPLNPEGGYDVKTYTGIARVPLNGERYDANVQVHACYQYQTLAEAAVCVDPTPNDLVDKNEVCDYRDAVQIAGTQGGPVAVSRVIAENTRDYINFRIWVSNVGPGLVAELEAFGPNCPLGLRFTEINKVIVEADMPFDGQPQCTPSGLGGDPVRLGDNGEGFIFCRFRKPQATSAFLSPLQVRLWYSYADSIETRVSIVNPEATS